MNKRLSINFKRFGAALALAALGASALGQHSSGLGKKYTNVGPGGFVQRAGIGGRATGPEDQIPVKLGSRIKDLATGAEYPVTKEGVDLPVGAAIMIDGVRAVVPPPRSEHNFGIYPLAIYSVGGQLYNRSKQVFDGGTRSVAGTILSYDAISNLDFGRRFEIGGFYFFPYDDNNGDLGQIALRYFPNKDVGIQVAYIDSTDFKASSGSVHLLLDMASKAEGVARGRQFSGRLGLGILENFNKQYDFSSESVARRDTINFSAFVDLSLQLSGRLSLNATEWFIRDRNADINRFGLGLAYRF